MAVVLGAVAVPVAVAVVGWLFQLVLLAVQDEVGHAACSGGYAQSVPTSPSQGQSRRGHLAAGRHGWERGEFDQ